jgi:hypothetical protein
MEILQEVAMRRMLITLAALALVALAGPAVASAHHGHGARDRNRDGLPDRWERQHNLSLNVNQAHRDPDRDGLDNRNEFEHGTDPNNPDTDDNGVRDRNEVNPVGTIASFNAGNGALTITLANGQQVTGTVNPATRIRCENENEVENQNEIEHQRGDDGARAARDGGDSSGGGDNSGPGSGGGDNSGSGSGSGGGDNSGPGSGGGDNTTSTTTTTQPNNSGPGSANSGPGNAEQGQQGQPGDNNDQNQNCGTAALVAGAPVREAEARLTGNGLVFEEIEVGPVPQQAPAPMPQQ